MLLQCLQLTGKLVTDPVKEIRLNEIAVVVIPAKFLAANSNAALALIVTAGIYCFAASGIAPARMLNTGW